MLTLWNVMTLRLKIIYKSPSIRILALVIITINFLLLNELYRNAEESAQLKIGVVDLDNSPFSEQIIENLDANDIMQVFAFSETEGIKVLKDNRIEALFMINEGAFEAVSLGQLEGVITVYFVEDNFLPMLLVDLFASEMIGEISIQKTVNLIIKAIERLGYNNEARVVDYQTGRDMLSDLETELYVNFTYVNQNLEDEGVEDIQSDLLYTQMILGIMLAFLAFFMMFTLVNIVRDQEIGIRRKTLMTPMNKLMMSLAEGLSGYLATLPLLIVMSIVNGLYHGHYFKFLIVLTLYTIGYFGIFMVFAKLFDKVTVFVVFGTAMIVILGIVSGSFFSVDVSTGWAAIVAGFIPTYHTLAELVNLQIVGDYKSLFFYASFMGLYFMSGIVLYAWSDSKVSR